MTDFLAAGAPGLRDAGGTDLRELGATDLRELGATDLRAAAGATLRREGGGGSDRRTLLAFAEDLGFFLGMGRRFKTRQPGRIGS